MKTKITLLSLLAFLCLIPSAFAQCTSGSQNPSQTYTPTYDGNQYIIHDNSHPGEYMRVNTLSTATIYNFQSSQPTDYITITDANGSQIFASGLNGNNGINFTPPYPQPIRFYIHANANCESNPFSTRTRYLKTTTVTYPCDSPSTFAVSNITSNSAKVSWTAPVIGSEFSYDIYTNTTGINPVANTTPTTEVLGDTEGQLSGLNSASTYYYWVRTQCVADVGIWVPAGSFTTNPFSSCNGASYGLYPDATFTLACNGTVEQIVADAYAGEYSNVSVNSNQQYTFSSSVATDFITITDPTGVTVYTSGQTPLVWVNNSNWSTVRYYLHTNGSCNASTSPRIKSIKCGGDVIGGCTSGYVHPSTAMTPACTGSLELIVNDAWAGEFSNINVTAGKQYTFSSSISGDYMTITNPIGNVVLATGVSPLVWNSGTTSGVVRYYLHANVNCGTQNINRQRYIQCSNSTPTCGAPTALLVSNITSNSCRLNWTAPATAPGSGYDIYIVTTNTAPTANTAATVTSTTAGVGVLNGLTAATTYYYWIRSNCGTQKSAWVSGGTVVTNAALVCNGAISGLYPDATFTPACTGTAEQIATDSWAGEYSNVTVLTNKQYTFTSSIATDFITITNAAGTSVLASGLTPLSWTSGSTSGVIRYHINTNANCGTQNTSRIRSIQCTNATTTCGAPSALAVSNITSNSVRLTWTAPTTAPASGYDLYIVTTNTAPVANTAATVTSTTAGIGVLYGINAATTYYYWIRSNCGSEKSAWISGGSFATIASLTCNGARYGLYPDATFTPACSGSNEQIATDTYAGEYSNVNASANKQYTFTSSIATDYITITNATGTTVLASGLTPLSWASGSTTGIIRYHINSDVNCGFQEASRIRSIKCTTATVVCGSPTNLAVSNVTSNSVRLIWTQPNPVPAYYEVYYVTNNTAPTVSSSPNYTSSGDGVWALPVNPATTYYYWVRSNCGATKGNWVSGGSFTTIPALNCNGAIFGLNPSNTFTPSCTGSNEVISDQVMPGQYSNVMVTSNKQYTFTSSVATDYITITNDAGTVVYTSGLSPLTWSTGNISSMVRYHMNTNSNCGVTDISRIKYIKCNTTTPTCVLPFELYHSNVTSNSAQLNWLSSSQPSIGYEIYVSSNSTAPVAGTTATYVTTNTAVYPYTGLNAGTTYYYWVRSNCGTTKSAWVAGGSFTTIPALTCNGAIFGLHPMDTFSPSCTGSNELVTDFARPGSYSNIVISENRQYTFTSSVATDFITITNAAGTVVLASGTSPLIYNTGNMNQAVVRYHTNSNANCGTDAQMGSWKWVKCIFFLGVDDNISENQMKIHPNPSAGSFTVETGNIVPDQIAIFDSLGRTIKTFQPTATKSDLNIAELADGVYYVKINYQNKGITKKLILKK